MSSTDLDETSLEEANDERFQKPEEKSTSKSTESSLIDNEKELQSVNLTEVKRSSTSDVSKNAKSKPIKKAASVRSILKPVSRYSIKDGSLKPPVGLSQKTSDALDEIIKIVQSDSLTAASAASLSSRSTQKMLAFDDRRPRRDKSHDKENENTNK